MRTRRSVEKLVALLACSFMMLPALAADTEYEAGVKAYKAKDYKTASEQFARSIQKGNKSAAVWLYCGHCFSALGQYPRAYKTYEIITNSFKGSPEATSAAQSMEAIKDKAGMSAAAPADSKTAGAGAAPAAAATPAPPGSEGLMSRIIVVAPQFGHQPVLPASISAAREAVAALPKRLRKMLDESDAKIFLAPNMIDRWPESMNDLPEGDPPPTLAELPGRIYGKEMCVYERAKCRHSSGLKEARPAKMIRLQVGNMCFQLLDDMMVLSKDPALRQEWEADKEHIPPEMVDRLATFMKSDDWGPRETCSELFGSMLGGYDENTDLLYRYFPRTKQWLSKKLGV